MSVELHDHVVRKGALALGGVGFIAGLFAPPLLVATAVGAAVGAGVGKLLHHKVESTLEKQAEEPIPIAARGGPGGRAGQRPHRAAHAHHGRRGRQPTPGDGERGAPDDR
jgi:hypothetical protein